MSHLKRPLILPFLLSRTAVRARYRLASRILLYIALTLLIFTLSGGQAGAGLPYYPFTSRTAVASNRISNTDSRDDDASMLRLRYLAWRRILLTEKPPLANHTSSKPQVAPGVTLSTEVLQTVAGPEQVSMLDIDLTTPNLHLGVVQANNQLISPDETMTSMAKRTNAVAGINGDFFEVGGSGVPIGEEVINSQLLHSPSPHFYAVFGVTSSGQLTIGTETLSGVVIDGVNFHPLYSINHYSQIDYGRLLLFTPALGKPDYIGGDPVALIKPVAGSSSKFIVQSVYSGATWLPALSGQDALLGSSEAGDWIAATLHKGDYISVNWHISPDGNLVQAIGGGPQVVKDGALYYDPYQPVPGEAYSRNPQTAIGLTKDGTHVLMVVFDGRLSGPARSRGMTHAEVASFMLAHGAYNAMLFDSGGSTEMVARLPGHDSVSVVNWPSEGVERPVANGLCIYISDPVPALPTPRYS